MSRYSYTLNRDAIPKATLHYYSREELELMTTSFGKSAGRSG